MSTLLNDPEDAISTNPEVGHSFRGQPLAKFSFGHRAALYRLGGGVALLPYEESPYLVFMLLHKKPHEVDALRTPDALSKFRAEAQAWSDKNGIVTESGWNEVHAIARAILKATEDAEAVAVAPSTSAGKSVPPIPND
jgi:hypothetical protein